MSGNTREELAPRLLTFDQMNLQVGMRLQLIVHRTLRPVQHFSTVVGWAKDEFLIVRTPLEHGKPIALREGEKVTLRVFSGVNVCSFPAVVERVFGRPLCYVHLTFPDRIKGTSLRTAMRVKVDIPAQVVLPDGEAAPALLANLSVSGALMELGQPLARDGDDITVQFTLLAEPDHREVTIGARAAVRNVSTVEPDGGAPGRYGYGLQFIDLDPSHYILLQNLTYQALIEDRQKIV